MKHLKLFENFDIDEAKDQREVTWKDKGRIDDMIKKANGNVEKIKQLAQQMAKSITDGYKALRRALAAEDENYHDVARIFYDRAAELGVK